MDIELLDDGLLEYKDGLLYYKVNDNINILPIDNIGTISIDSNVILDSYTLSKLLEYNINIYIHNNKNNIAGICTNNSTNNGSNTISQAKAYISNKRITIAGKILISAIYNMSAILKQYNMDISNTIFSDYNNINNTIKECSSIEQLLLVEAKTRKLYYSYFNSIINNNDFVMNKRTYYPARDNINALISYINALLYRVCLDSIYKQHLNPSIAYLHASNNRNTSLEYDISEVFKPILVDRLIFSLINNKQISNEDFSFTDEGVRISFRARKIIIDSFNKRLKKTIKINNKYISYKELINRDCHNLRQYINTNSKLEFYRSRW